MKIVFPMVFKMNFVLLSIRISMLRKL
uniref:Uncharacterized protein n=1 Tax=Megaselia scalaris TaxID=36166 RepID=T1H5L6_MEGSC